MKRKLCALLLALALILSLSIPAYAAFNSEARNAVVVVSTCMDTPYGEFSFGTGTGFFINEQHLVTNHHVIDTFEEYGSGEQVNVTVNGTATTGRAKIRVYYDANDYEEAYIVGNNKIKDIAVLKLDKPTDKRSPLTLKVPTESLVGSTIYAIGFPGLADNAAADSTKSWGVNDSTVTSGTISRLLTTSGTGQQNVQIDCDIKHGNSGGPVVDESGAVIGVATWGYSNTAQMENINYAVNIQEAISIMNQYGVAYTLASEAVEQPAQDPAQEPLPLPAEPEKDNLGLIIGLAVGGAVLVAAVIVIIVMASGKKKKAAQAAAAAAPVFVHQEPRAKTPVVRSNARANFGASARVAGQPVMIGRSNDCALQFPQNTAGVSGCHCTVQWDAASQSFAVTDLRSTYGTFLMNGQKMQPNVPYRLRAGEKFYMGDQNNTISLELE